MLKNLLKPDLRFPVPYIIKFQLRTRFTRSIFINQYITPLLFKVVVRHAQRSIYCSHNHHIITMHAASDCWSVATRGTSYCSLFVWHLPALIAARRCSSAGTLSRVSSEADPRRAALWAWRYTFCFIFCRCRDQEDML